MTDFYRRLLEMDDAELDRRWQKLQTWLEKRFGRQPGIEPILFLIGIQSKGQGYQPKLKKEHKQDLIMEGTYCVFERIGLYQRAFTHNGDGERWLRVGAPVPELSVDEQEKLLRIAILKYFDDMIEADG